MNKGFTLIELLIAFLIVVIFAAGIAVAFLGGKETMFSEEKICQSYRFSTLQEVPAICLKYFK